MTEYLVGTGGWAYFRVPKVPSLRAYSEAFNFVEVNYTFYNYPDLRTTERWRKTVPKNFTFAVRCHQDLTHRIGLNSVEEAYAVLGRMIAYCRSLHSPFLVLETPASYVFDKKNVDAARVFLTSAEFDDVRLVWESRAPVTSELVILMRDFGIVHSVDLSKEEPAFASDVIYTRLFGKGRHNLYQFTDEELMEIDRRALKTGAKVVVMSYHGVRMNSDASRFLKYKRTGVFPTVTSFTGLNSAEAVLSEDVHFPISKQDLIERHGWKVVDATQNRRVHLSDFLSKIPDKSYQNLNEVMQAVEAEI